MLTLNELSKQAEELYNKFLNDIQDMQDASSDVEDDYDDYYSDEVISKSGHYDEQALENYRYATNEDGEYIHRLNKPINGYSD